MKDKLIAAALALATKKGYRNVTRDDIAAAAKVSAGTVTYHLGEMRKVHAAIVEAAIAQRNIPVLAQALAANHSAAAKAPPELKQLAGRLIAGTT